MKETKKLLVWSDQYNNEWEKDYKEEYPDATDEEIMDAWHEEAHWSFGDEKRNLSIPISGDVLVIKTLNLWDGQFTHCSIIHRNTIGDLMERFFDGSSFYVEEDTGDFVGEAYHHDGTNYYRFREVSADACSDDINSLVHKIESGEDYAADLAKLTKSFGGRIAKVYGWQVNANDE